MTELARPVPLASLGKEFALTVEATEAERAAIARRLLVPSVEAVRCEWTLRPSTGGVVLAGGRLHAWLHQDCVVSLEPFPVEVTEAFAVRFVPAGQESDAADDPDEPDELPYDGAALDLGEATVEQLALSLDPYPRKPDAVLPDGPGDQAAHPFGALAGLRRPQ